MSTHTNQQRTATDAGHLDENGRSLPKILIVGSPNVGKSALFNRLTGRYVTVSNYPGTTVEISRGRTKISATSYEVCDTPGMYSLSSITEEERVACNFLQEEPSRVVVHVVDAKNIKRMLGLTLQLAEAGLPLVLVLNMADEARRLGMQIDIERLQKQLGIPVVETVATTGEGLDDLTTAIGRVGPARGMNLNYGAIIEEAIIQITALVEPEEILAPRTCALFRLLHEGDGGGDTVSAPCAIEKTERLQEIIADTRSKMEHSVHYQMTLATQQSVDQLLDETVSLPAKRGSSFREKLSLMCMRPLTGIPLLVVVLYFGLYKFVGEFGAGVMVDFLETDVFLKHINPWAVNLFSAVLPWEPLKDLFVGEYGIVTLGIRYAVAIILPIVGTFFIAFSILEDSGYLPRLAMLIDRIFKKIGLNGRAVIPMVLGFGCDTMATMVTRTLETRREKIIASLLLALAIPCSAQLGVIFALLAGHPLAVLAWALFVTGIFLFVGFLAARLLPGERPSFYMELPPLRMPRPVNVLVKTYTRVVWYFKEIFPLFILASIFIWIGQLTHLFALCVRAFEPLVRFIGLPAEAATAFLFGFFRRDYGAAGLYDLQKAGELSGVQLTVAAITLTLFLPCIAQFLMLKKERGWRMALISSSAIFVGAFVVGFLANLVFKLSGVTL